MSLQRVIGSRTVSRKPIQGEIRENKQKEKHNWSRSVVLCCTDKEMTDVVVVVVVVVMV